MQTVIGYTALETGVRVLPIAAGMILASKASVVLSQRIGTKLVVAAGLGTVAASLALVAGFEVDSSYPQIGTALGMIGVGIGLAMSPATEAIMGALPREKAGIGSAMNDVVREVGGTLGIAVLGSLLTSYYGSSMDDAVAGLPAGAAESASDSVGAAHGVAAHIGGGAGSHLVETANQAFVDGLATTSIIAAGAAVIGALIALVFLPARAGGEAPAAALEPAAA
jgi:hypothetical protein